MQEDVLDLRPEDVAQMVQKASAKLNLDPDTVEQDIAKLVLALMEFLRQLMETQAIRRMENGTLCDAEIDRLGTALMRSEQAILDMAERFDLQPEDLSLSLGPLGRTV